MVMMIMMTKTIEDIYIYFSLYDFVSCVNKHMTDFKYYIENT